MPRPCAPALALCPEIYGALGGFGAWHCVPSVGSAGPQRPSWLLAPSPAPPRHACAPCEHVDEMSEALILQLHQCGSCAWTCYEAQASLAPRSASLPTGSLSHLRLKQGARETKPNLEQILNRFVEHALSSSGTWAQHRDPFVSVCMPRKSPRMQCRRIYDTRLHPKNHEYIAIHCRVCVRGREHRAVRMARSCQLMLCTRLCERAPTVYKRLCVVSHENQAHRKLSPPSRDSERGAIVREQVRHDT